MGSGSLTAGEQLVGPLTATFKTLTALRASQKAVHANPGQLIGWSVLSAAVATHNISEVLMQKVNESRQSYSVKLARFVSSQGIADVFRYLIGLHEQF